MYCSGVYEILLTNQLITAALYCMSVEVTLIGVLGTEGPVKYIMLNINSNGIGC